MDRTPQSRPKFSLNGIGQDEDIFQKSSLSREEYGSRISSSTSTSLNHKLSQCLQQQADGSPIAQNRTYCQPSRTFLGISGDNAITSRDNRQQTNQYGKLNGQAESIHLPNNYRCNTDNTRTVPPQCEVTGPANQLFAAECDSAAHQAIGFEYGTTIDPPIGFDCGGLPSLSDAVATRLLVSHSQRNSDISVDSGHSSAHTAASTVLSENNKVMGTTVPTTAIAGMVGEDTRGMASMRTMPLSLHPTVAPGTVTVKPPSASPSLALASSSDQCFFESNIGIAAAHHVHNSFPSASDDSHGSSGSSVGISSDEGLGGSTSDARCHFDGGRSCLCDGDGGRGISGGHDVGSMSTCCGGAGVMPGGIGSHSGGGRAYFEHTATACPYATAVAQQRVCGDWTDEQILLHWLNAIQMGIYYCTFMQAGYDLVTMVKMTPEDLNAVGVTNPAHRRRLRTELSHLARVVGSGASVPPPPPPSFADQKSCCGRHDSLAQWLHRLRLDQYYPLLLSQGYKTLPQATQLTWEDLQDIGIQKLGHQKKLMLAVDHLRRKKTQNTCHTASTGSPSQTVPPVRNTAVIEVAIRMSQGDQTCAVATNNNNINNNNNNFHNYNGSPRCLEVRPKFMEIISEESAVRSCPQSPIFSSFRSPHITTSDHYAQPPSSPGDDGLRQPEGTTRKHSASSRSNQIVSTSPARGRLPLGGTAGCRQRFATPDMQRRNISIQHNYPNQREKEAELLLPLPPLRVDSLRVTGSLRSPNLVQKPCGRYDVVEELNNSEPPCVIQSPQYGESQPTMIGNTGHDRDESDWASMTSSTTTEVHQYDSPLRSPSCKSETCESLSLQCNKSNTTSDSSNNLDDVCDMLSNLTLLLDLEIEDEKLKQKQIALQNKLA